MTLAFAIPWLISELPALLVDFEYSESQASRLAAIHHLRRSVYVEPLVFSHNALVISNW